MNLGFARKYYSSLCSRNLVFLLTYISDDFLRIDLEISTIDGFVSARLLP